MQTPGAANTRHNHRHIAVCGDISCQYNHSIWNKWEEIPNAVKRTKTLHSIHSFFGLNLTNNIRYVLYFFVPPLSRTNSLFFQVTFLGWIVYKHGYSCKTAGEYSKRYCSWLGIKVFIFPLGSFELDIPKATIWQNILRSEKEKKMQVCRWMMPVKVHDVTGKQQQPCRCQHFQTAGVEKAVLMAASTLSSTCNLRLPALRRPLCAFVQTPCAPGAFLWFHKNIHCIYIYVYLYIHIYIVRI